MKTFDLAFALALATAVASTSSAQVVNGSFETWTDGDPDGWATSNVPPIGSPITPSGNAHSGSSSVLGTVLPLAGQYNLNAIIQSGPEGEGFAISEHYSSITGYYQFTAAGGDMFGVNVVLSPVRNDTGTAVGATKLGPAATWTQFTVPLTYYLPGEPDTANIQFMVVGPTNGADVHVGSVFQLDDIVLTTAPTAVEPAARIPVEYVLAQNFPNPFNPTTEIEYSLASPGHVSLAVFDILGREVARLVDAEQPAGAHRVRFDAGGLSSGVYIYRIRTAGSVQQKRMVLLK